MVHLKRIHLDRTCGAEHGEVVCGRFLFFFADLERSIKRTETEIFQRYWLGICYQEECVEDVV